MALSIVKLASSDTIYLLADGLNFKVVTPTITTDTIVESNSKKLLSWLNGGTEVEKIIRRIKDGEQLDVIDKTISLSLYGLNYSSSNFMIFTVIVNDIDKSTWTGNILRDEGTIFLPAGVIKDILEYLLSIGIKPQPKPYYRIIYVEALPITQRTDIAWLLTKDFEDKKAGTIWRWDGEKWEPLEDTGDSHFPEDRPSGGGGGNFIISVEEPQDLEPGDVWGRIDPA